MNEFDASPNHSWSYDSYRQGYCLKNSNDELYYTQGHCSKIQMMNTTMTQHLYKFNFLHAMSYIRVFQFFGQYLSLQTIKKIFKQRNFECLKSFQIFSTNNMYDDTNVIQESLQF